MIDKDISRQLNDEKLSANEDYYNNVFKKTERIISATFYIVSFIEDIPRNQRQVSLVLDAASATHAQLLASLLWRTEELVRRRFELQQSLVALESALGILIASRLVTAEVVASVSTEIDTVLRYLKNHYALPVSVLGASTKTTTTAQVSAVSPTRRSRPIIPKNDLSSDAVLVYSQLNDRTGRIKTVLEAKPNATIKDLTEIITDVSAKTIQRDLNSLIEQGEVIRQGERRWSTYSIAS
jgi:hypothetical protein